MLELSCQTIEGAPSIDKVQKSIESEVVSLPISLVIIAKNEADNIRRCIQSVPFASEVLVVENGSTDRTRELAEAAGARVLSREWAGFGPQKRWAAEQAKHDWVLALDADEALSPELAREIHENFSGLNPKAVHFMPRLSWHLGRWIRHGGWYPDFQPRLFHRKHSQWTLDQIHERIESAEATTQKSYFKNPVEHFVFKSLSHQVVTNDRYSTLQAESYVAGGGKYSCFKALVKPWVKFIECYFLKLGFLDGYPGFVIAVGAGYSVFIRWAKIWEIEMNLKIKKRSAK